VSATGPAQGLTPEEQERRDRMTLDLAERRRLSRQNAMNRRQARIDFEKHVTAEAKAEREYKERKAIRYVEHRNNGDSSEGARIKAEGDVAELKQQRDLSKGMAKAALLRVDESEAERVVIRDLGDLSEAIDGKAE